jgi:hypothetical protein
VLLLQGRIRCPLVEHLGERQCRVTLRVFIQPRWRCRSPRCSTNGQRMRPWSNNTSLNSCELSLRNSKRPGRAAMPCHPQSFHPAPLALPGLCPSPGRQACRNCSRSSSSRFDLPMDSRLIPRSASSISASTRSPPPGPFDFQVVCREVADIAKLGDQDLDKLFDDIVSGQRS